MAIRILSGENITGDITTSGKVNAGDRILTEATTSNALLQVKYNASNYLEAYYDTLNVVGGDFLIKRVGDTKIRLTAVGTTFTNLSNTSAASSSVDEVKIGTFGAGRPAIFLGSSNTTYTNSTWFIENIGASGKFRIGRNGLDILEIENGGASTFKGPSVTVLNASDPSVAVSDTDTNYKGIMTWRNSGSENVLEFVTRYAGTYYTNNLVLDRGNVGIGTASPDAQLEIEKSASGAVGPTLLLNNSAGGNSDKGAIIYASYGNTYQRAKIEFTVSSETNNPGNIDFYTGRSDLGTLTSKMTILGSGNVIIGNTNVDNPNSLDKVLEIEHGGSVGVILNDSRDTPIGLENRGAVFHLTHNTNSRLVVDGASGDVGIGTTLPGEKLEVNGVIQIKRVGDHPAIRFVENTTTRGYIGTGDWAINGLSDADLGISSASAGSLVLGTNSGNGRVYIVNGGNVGINAATPRDKLTVFTAGSSEQEIGLRLVNPIGFTNAGSGASIIFAQDRSQTENLPMAKIRSSQTAAGSSCCGDLIFSTSHTSLGGMIDRMKITASGTVGIPNDVGSFSGAASLVLTKKSGVPYIQYQYSGTSTSFRLEMDEYVTSGNVRQYFTQTNAGVSSGFSMTFNTGSVIFGDLEVASATVNSGSAFKKDSKARMTLCQASNSTALTDLQEYFNPNGAVGKIQTSGSATLFTTSSDYRLKEDLKSFSGLEMVSKIPVYDFKWKISDERSYGVMAHELQEVLPQAVGGDKDYEKEHVVKKAEYDDNHNLIKDAEYGKRPSYQTVDYSKIVPLLVKSIQELKAEIELLKNK